MHADIALELIRTEKVDLNVTENERGMTPLLLALEKMHVEVALEILKNENVDFKSSPRKFIHVLRATSRL